MNDPSMLAYHLTFAGTLLIAAVMGVGQVLAFTILSVLAAAVRTVGWFLSRFRRRAGPTPAR